MIMSLDELAKTAKTSKEAKKKAEEENLQDYYS